MKQKVISILQVTDEDYSQLILDLYFDWCSGKTKNQKSLQKVLTCPPLFNWWYRELSSLEQRFVEHTACFGNSLAQSIAMTYYRDTISEIYNLFSKPLIQKANDGQTVTK